VSDHPLRDTDFAVRELLCEFPGVNNISITALPPVPAGVSINSTVTPGFAWSVCPVGSAGSPANRTASAVVNCAPDGALRIVAVNVWPSRDNVAVDPDVVTVALVCARHIMLPVVVISSRNSTCCRPFTNRIPRFTEVLSNVSITSKLFHYRTHTLPYALVKSKTTKAVESLGTLNTVLDPCAVPDEPYVIAGGSAVTS